jgi:hypothetical protein
MKADKGTEVYLHSFIILTVDRGEWSASCPAALPLGKEFSNHTEYTGGWVHPCQYSNPGLSSP